MTTEVTLAAEQLSEIEKKIAQDAADVARYRFLLEHCGEELKDHIDRAMAEKDIMDKVLAEKAKETAGGEA